MKVYFIGSHSTGKTTMARFVSSRYGVPMISEVARAVLAEMEIPLEGLRTDIDLVNRYQTRVFEKQIEVERNYKAGFVSDRAFDSLAYTAEHATVLASVMESKQFRDYMKLVREGTIFFLRPHSTLLSNDGVRETVNWEGVIRIDGMIKFLLEQFRFKYIPVQSLSMQERVKIVEFVLGPHGGAQGGRKKK
ncbi:MAG: ATP-binding protein [Pseudomonadota bacterium]